MMARKVLRALLPTMASAASIASLEHAGHHTAYQSNTTQAAAGSVNGTRATLSRPIKAMTAPLRFFIASRAASVCNDAAHTRLVQGNDRAQQP